MGEKMGENTEDMVYCPICDTEEVIQISVFLILKSYNQY